ncbi:Maf family protein [bacterium]|nr:Maf family protein [bacterium]
MARPLILASTSASRKQTLERLGYLFEVSAPQVDEHAWKQKGLPATVLAETLAIEKAKSIGGRVQSAVVIGADQIVKLEGKNLGKPGTPEAAQAQLRQLSGKTHSLITSVAVWTRDSVYKQTDITRVTLRELDDTTILRYVLKDKPIDCCGSYRFEAHGPAIIENVETQDPTAIQGLPLLWLGGLLAELGYTWQS